MYCEEQIINGVLHVRSAPDAEWRPAARVPHGAAVAELLKLNDEQRLDAFRLFCVHCGCIQAGRRGCQCWNDE